MITSALYDQQEATLRERFRDVIWRRKKHAPLWTPQQGVKRPTTIEEFNGIPEIVADAVLMDVLLEAASIVEQKYFDENVAWVRETIVMAAISIALLSGAFAFYASVALAGLFGLPLMVTGLGVGLLIGSVAVIALLYLYGFFVDQAASVYALSIMIAGVDAVMGYLDKLEKTGVNKQGVH